MKIKFIQKMVLVAALAIGLAGCSGEPSSSAMQGEVQKAIDKANSLIAAMAAMTGKPAPKIEIKSFSKLGCTAQKDKKDTYTCEFEAELMGPGKGGKGTETKKEKGRILMVKGSDGWIGTPMK